MTLLRSDRYASANTAHIMIVTMSGLHKAVPGQNELKRIRDQILIICYSYLLVIYYRYKKGWR